MAGEADLSKVYKKAMVEILDGWAF